LHYSQRKALAIKAVGADNTSSGRAPHPPRCPVPTDKRSEQMRFTEKQGQYLAFIYNYSKIHGRAPAEADMERYFRVTPPTVHQMVLKLENKGLIARVPGQPRSITLLLQPEELPMMK
jgi:repressor LexA